MLLKITSQDKMGRVDGHLEKQLEVYVKIL